MEISNKKNHLYRIRVSFIIILFIMCSVTGMLFCGTNNPYEISDKSPAIETWAISESIVVDGDGDNTTDFKAPFLYKNDSRNETIEKNIITTLLIAAIPKGISLLLFLIIVFLFFFLNLFIVLPDGWTLINQKVRLDN